MRRKFIQRWSTIQPLNSNHCTQRGTPDFSVLDESNSINASWALNLISMFYPMLLGVLLLSVPFFSKFVLHLCSYLHYNLMFWSELFLLSDISLESGILCLCIYNMNPLKMSILVTEETNMNCSDWVNLNGSHIHKSTYNTYLQILQIKVTFMHAYIYIYVRHLQWRQLFLECYVYRHRLLMICTCSP